MSATLPHRTGPDPEPGAEPGPLDLRLVPPALAAWATAALTLDAPVDRTVWIVAVSLLGGIVLLGASRAGPEPPGPPGRRSGWARASLAAVLLCVAASAASAGLQGADVRRGPVPELARRSATVTADIELTGDPWLSRPRVRGDHTAPAAVLIRAKVRRVEESDGRSTRTRAPVLVVVDGGVAGPERSSGPRSEQETSEIPEVPDRVRGAAGDGSAPAAGGSRARAGQAGWLRLLPSTRLRVGGRLAPALVGGDRTAAVLRVRGLPGARVLA
ncbi:MBL fold metallo-hydrolase, partial [Streptomyces sp. SID6137]|nr:MBL fold metallo-hydrolase [Streptomyces sp. SID6137]